MDKFKSNIYYKKYFHGLISGFSRTLYRLWGGFDIYGADNIPQSGKFILAANHISLTDPPAIIASSRRPLRYMAAEELFRIPYLGPFCYFLGGFPVKRGEYDAQAVKVCRELLQKGEGVVLYPEGKLSLDGRLGHFYPGAALMAIREKCLVIPAATVGTDKFLPRGGKYLHFAHKSIRYGRPIDICALTEGLPLRERLDKATEIIRQAIIALARESGKDIS